MLRSLQVLFAFTALLAVFSPSASAQVITVKGKVQDTLNQAPVPGVEIKLPTVSTFTDASGAFSFQISKSSEPIVLTIYKPGFLPREISIITDEATEVDLGLIELGPQESIDQIAAEDIIPTITLSSDESQSLGTDNVSGILTASRDVFASTAAFNFGSARFQIRGYDSENTLVYFNGVPVNDSESGGVYYGQWGGLNDVTRSSNNSIGLEATEFSFGGIGGASSIDTRASFQRKQLRVSYALSNRTYRNRLMATWSSGILKNGWAFSLSGSRRWGNEGYVAGTFYDAWSYFASIDKQLGEKSSLNLTVLGAPNRRGKSSAATKEMYDLAGTNFYNSYWGYQNGEKRNSQVADTHQPMGILRHDWQLSSKTELTTAVSYTFGRDGDTALDWYDARDPRPDYYRRLPSYIDDPIQAAAVEELLRENEDLRQINWDYMYNANNNSVATIENANGIAGNTVTGKRAQYIVEDRRTDRQVFNFNTVLHQQLSDRIALQGGLNYQWYRSKNFKVVDDLLGADFYLDIDKFAEFSNASGDPIFIQNDLTTPNRILHEGDKFGYNYDIYSQKANVWAQANISLQRFDFFAAGNVGRIIYWRDGQVANGKFPENSFGESEKPTFTEFGGKAGVTYKLDGRNYLFVNGAYLQRAPFIRNVFIAPRTRNDIADNLVPEKITSFEGGYLLKAPYFKGRAVGYFTRFEDQLYTRSFYLDNAIAGSGGTTGGFVNYVMSGINTQHAGVELAAEWSVVAVPGLKLNAVAAMGQYIYTDRPDVAVYLDYLAEKISDRTVYIKNFYVPNGPQSAYSFGVNYNSKDFWFVDLNFNYFDDIWIDFYPERRTSEAVALVDNPVYADQIIPEGSPLWNQIINQEKASPAFTMDIFGGKSWKFGNVYLYLNLGINNILDKKDFVTGGYEQFRFDFQDKNVDKFPNRYFYSYGRTYFASLALRI